MRIVFRVRLVFALFLPLLRLVFVVCLRGNGTYRLRLARRVRHVFPRLESCLARIAVFFFTAVVMLLAVCSLSFAPPAIIMCVISVLLFTACNCDKNVGSFT